MTAAKSTPRAKAHYDRLREIGIVRIKVKVPDTPEDRRAVRAFAKARCDAHVKRKEGE